MARIRTVRPIFFTSLTVASVSIRARLLFIGLFTHVDDAGRQVYEPRLVKAAIFPLDDDISAADVAADIEELHRAGLVSIYRVKGREYILVVGFLEHQRINKPTPSTLPAPPSSQTREDSGSPPVALLESSPEEGKGREGNGMESSAAAGGWPVRVATLWSARVGPMTSGRVGKQLKPFVDAYPSTADAEAALSAAIEHFVEIRRNQLEKGNTQPDNWAQFVRDLLDYVPGTLKPKREAA